MAEEKRGDHIQLYIFYHLLCLCDDPYFRFIAIGCKNARAFPRAGCTHGVFPGDGVVHRKTIVCYEGIVLKKILKVLNRISHS